MQTGAKQQNPPSDCLAEFTGYSRTVLPRLDTLENCTEILPQFIDLLWSNQRLSDAFAENRRGWPLLFSKEMGINSSLIKRAIDTFGINAVKALANTNPAGEAPAAAAANKKLNFGSGTGTCGSCLHGTGTCGSCLHGTGTCGSCICYSPDIKLTKN
ncbi:MAG: hypothetical protein EOM37_10915 [Proteobacteria bacterium]|nr:hypothetical protein [Pseudomonadota bacterium]